MYQPLELEAGNSELDSGQDEMTETEWQRYEIPRELRLVQAGTPSEICKVIRDSMIHYKAIRSSIFDAQMHAEDTLSDVTDKPQVNDCNRPGQRGTGRSTTGVARSNAIYHRRAASDDSTASSRMTGPSSRSSIGQDSMTSVTTSCSSISLATDDSPQDPSKTVSPVSLEANQTNILAPLASNVLSEGSLSTVGDELNQTSNVSNIDTTALVTQPRAADNSPIRSGLCRLFRRKPSKSENSESRLSALLAAKTVIATKECASCFDDVPSANAIGLACQHHYCSSCFSQLVSTAMQHENFYPPKCCLQEIPKKTLEKNLTSTELSRFKLKAKEYAVPAGERWYCCSSSCGKWFDNSRSHTKYGTVSCPHCRLHMCKLCRGPRHPLGGRCPQDVGLDATLEQAELEGWRRCYNCHTMVELARGCRHITCKCKAEFWWKSCNCTEEDELRRRERLRTQREALRANEAELRAEEEEVRAAVAAVAASIAEARRREEHQAELERQERQRTEEARIAKEAQEIKRMEAERLGRIDSHFRRLRVSLAKLHNLQWDEINKRHQTESQQIEERLDLAAKHSDGENDRASQSADEKLKFDRNLQDANRNHANEFLTTITRHTVDQEKYLQKLQDSLGDKPDREVQKATMLKELLTAQIKERSTLRKSHKREIEKLDRRAAEGIDDDLLKKEAARLLKREQDTTAAANELKRSIFADEKWFEIVTAMQKSLLNEEKNHLTAIGADAPVSVLDSVAEASTKGRDHPKVIDRCRSPHFGAVSLESQA